MKFYYENNLGNDGTFEEKDLVKAIYTAWTTEINLYFLYLFVDDIWKLIFAPREIMIIIQNY